MPAAAPIPVYNTGQTNGMNNDTTATLSSGASFAGASGNAHVVVGSMVALSIAVIIAVHMLGFRFGFDVSVGRK